MIRSLQYKKTTTKSADRKGPHGILEQEENTARPEIANLDDRRLLHNCIFEHTRQGWQVAGLDKNSVEFIKPRKWNRALLIIGAFLIPLFGLGFLIWMLAALDFFTQKERHINLCVEDLRAGILPNEDSLTSESRLALILFGALLASWLLFIIPAVTSNTYQGGINISEELKPYRQRFLGVSIKALGSSQILEPEAQNTLISIAQLPSTTPTRTPTKTITPTASLTPFQPLPTEPSATSTASPTSTHTATPTLNPDDWRDWPVIPIISENARAIFQRGLENGNNPNNFSVIGDCQSVPYLFLGAYDWGGPIIDTLDDELFETVVNFAGSFSRYSPTIIDGGNAASQLATGWANRTICDVSESPITCELRLHKPSIVIVNIGTHWSARNEIYMRKIIEIIIDYEAVPILSTKADNLEGNAVINRDLALIALQYDIPLWNLWASVQDLPNDGLDPYRQGGYMYLTRDGLETRRLMGLQVLDTVWRAAK
ncbi:MAG: hypothetical protein MUO76_07105 [Anaerolineaceae bacterium]|nr:hypothetical protein [Anaerolineaceae bacterium]